MAKVGRPRRYTPELAKEICDTIATSHKALYKLCKEYDHWPAEKTIYTWLAGDDYPEFSQRYGQARRKQAERHAEWLEKIAEEVPTYIDDKGVERIDPGMMARQRLILDTRKWQASKLAPKIYGDKQTVTVEDDSENLKLKKEIMDLRAKLAEQNKKDY